MSEQFELTAETRTNMGKAASRRLRRLEDKVLAVVYGANKEPAHITLQAKYVIKALENEAFYSQIIALSVDGMKQKVILKALQRHPFKQKVLHMDFFRVSATEKLNITVPIHFIGEEDAPGTKEGGAFSHNINELEVRCLPADLPQFIEVDVSKMELDDVIHLSQITAPKNVEIVALAHGADQAHDHAVVTLHIPKVQAEPIEEVLEAAEGEEAAAEGEEKASEESSGEEKSSKE